MLGERNMASINERIKEFRNQLHLSQDYVAKYLKVSRSTYTQMENGKRKVLANEVMLLSNLFGVSTDSLLNGSELSQPATLFARSFENQTIMKKKYTQEDVMNGFHNRKKVLHYQEEEISIKFLNVQEEIMNLIRFKEQTKVKRK